VARPTGTARSILSPKVDARCAVRTTANSPGTDLPGGSGFEEGPERLRCRSAPNRQTGTILLRSRSSRGRFDTRTTGQPETPEKKGIDVALDIDLAIRLHWHGLTVSAATIWRHLKTTGLIVPQPKKRPKTSYIRFQADLPNETWQSDFTHWRLADDTDIEILTFLDDCSHYALDVTAHRAITANLVVDRFHKTATTMGYPTSVLTENGMVYTARFAANRISDLQHQLDQFVDDVPSQLSCSDLGVGRFDGFGVVRYRSRGPCQPIVSWGRMVLYLSLIHI